MTATRPDELPYTGDAEADALLARDPLALLIGFTLDQQVTVQKAFSGPLELQRRLGTLEASVIAGMDPGDLDEVFRAKPALHRFPGNMAKRTQALADYQAKKRAYKQKLKAEGGSFDPKAVETPGKH